MELDFLVKMKIRTVGTEKKKTDIKNLNTSGVSVVLMLCQIGSAQ